MPLRDDLIDWRWGHHRVNAQDIQTYVTAAGVGAGAPVFEEISTFGCVGLNMAAAGDIACHTEMIPPEIARNHKIYVHIWFVNSPGVATDTFEWIFLYSTIAEEEAMVVPATALDTVIGTNTVKSATALHLDRSMGIINQNSIPPTDDWWSWSIELNAADQTLSSEKLDLLCVEFEYVRQWTHGKRERRGARLTDPGGYQYGGRS